MNVIAREEEDEAKIFCEAKGEEDEYEEELNEGQNHVARRMMLVPKKRDYEEFRFTNRKASYTFGWIKTVASTIEVNERPWKYDVNAQHSRRTNTYSIENEGVKYSVFPLKNKSIKKEVRTFLVVTKEFKVKAKETKQIHTLVVKQILMAESKSQVDEPPKLVNYC
ncbi:hypothetical protein GH714_014304 [Hevea brasiliensis]|uniref:Uncharacterized protein n=1 Tax=Hevea brasiliensis TaxID=3981 RepID=A0A6A6NH25_HEVBR|nr:hypothetical protein GH714_014289 [Hevea brasiliensis]KAF2324453.1 hypothetical protein GH714_014304 [Hevea brasiliensis]